MGAKGAEVRSIAGIVAALAVAFVSIAQTGAEEPSHYTFAPKPPGAIVQSQLVYLAGEAMHSQWRGVLSKKLLGTRAGTSFYQWYLSIYAIDGTTYRLKYQSPPQSVPFDTVENVVAAHLFMPVQDAKIAGEGEFMGPAIQQLVVQSHQAAADCGMSRVDVFTADVAKQRVTTAVSVENPCDLQASIVHRAGGDAIALTGPYYASGAPLYKPTKNNAAATLRYAGGRWIETPNYFKIASQAR
jgi:hypothetical protein